MALYRPDKHTQISPSEIHRLQEYIEKPYPKPTISESLELVSILKITIFGIS